MTRLFPGVGRESLPKLGVIAVAALALSALSACLQTDPAGPEDGKDIEKPLEDNGRRAGATSSTNWPAEIANNRHKALWSFDSLLEIRFIDMPPVAPLIEQPVKRKGTLYLYPGNSIPAFDSVPAIAWSFPESEAIEIPSEKITQLLPAGSDTIIFNVRLDLDTLAGWFHGLQFDRKSGKIIETADSPIPANTVFLKPAHFFFQGAVGTVTSLLPAPAGNDPEISFYIPGTPNFCKAVSDSFFVGPLPEGDYPVRVVRTSTSQVSPGGTLVEIWELRISGDGTSSKFTLGDQVLSYQSKGKMTLRDKE